MTAVHISHGKGDHSVDKLRIRHFITSLPTILNARSVMLPVLIPDTSGSFMQKAPELPLRRFFKLFV